MLCNCQAEVEIQLGGLHCNFASSMLPSLGLFKASECPFNKDNSTGGCHRPFCHFKHPRKGTEIHQLSVFRNNMYLF